MYICRPSEIDLQPVYPSSPSVSLLYCLAVPARYGQRLGLVAALPFANKMINRRDDDTGGMAALESWWRAVKEQLTLTA